MFRRRGTSAILPLIFLIVASTSAAAQVRSPHYVVKVPVADMHALPSEDSDVVSQAILGTVVAAVEVNGAWLKVKTEDDYAGWTPLSELVEMNGSGVPSFARVSSLFANVYREPDVTEHQPILTAPFESQLEIIQETTADRDRWWKIRLPDGAIGFVQRGDVTLEQRVLTIPESVELAKRFVGFPYRWGGRSSYGYDCSGFTQMLVRSRGVIMPRDANLQAAWSGMLVIQPADLRPGDLLYFGSNDKITHTGMYIGNGEFIHSTTHDRPVVQISRLDDQPWARILVACRRVK